ncbi:hypothetical protein KY317_00520 [Candidatus Woesearchaeota archaeon]|nr:hypothetical protein [Candidatus Woesearchaeota archaeon]
MGFDTGPVISLVTNNLLWLLEPLRENYDGEFFITPAVKHELIDKAFMTRRFEFEALQVSQMFKRGILKVRESAQISKVKNKLLELANHSYKARGRWLKIVSDAEIEVLAADAVLDSDVCVIDERTARLVLENAERMRKLFERRLHCKIQMDKKNVREFQEILQDVQIIRSTELVTVSYKLGLLDGYLVDKSKFVKNPRKTLLESALWAVKIRGCSVSRTEIDEIVRKEL